MLGTGEVNKVAATVPTRDVTCPVCSADSEQKTSYGGYLLYECQKCGLVFVRDRQIPLEMYRDVYQKMPGYRWMFDVARKTANGEAGIRELWRYKRRAIFKLESLVEQKRMLDVGCGAGQFLLVARQRGWECQGVEIAEEAVQAARALGLTVFHGEIAAFQAESPERFPAVTSFEVLEHLVDPLPFVQVLRSLTADEGYFVCTVPNVDDPYCLIQDDCASMPPVHLNFFNRQSLGHLLRLGGFEVVEWFTLPVPTNSARRCLSQRKYLTMLPWMLCQWAMGKSDGTTLFAIARPATARRK